jgi:hypothetical protein
MKVLKADGSCISMETESRLVRITIKTPDGELLLGFPLKTTFVSDLKKVFDREGVVQIKPLIGRCCIAAGAYRKHNVEVVLHESPDGYLQKEVEDAKS